MAINFGVRVNKKKGPRIYILRAIKNKDGKREMLKSLGSLPEDLNKVTDLYKGDLDDFEQYQLENFVKTALLNKENFGESIDVAQREMIYFSPTFFKALFDLWKLAKEHKLDFTPHEVMLTALLNKMKAVERRINEKTGKSIEVLEKTGIDIHRFDKQEINKKLHSGSQALFNALAQSKKPLKKLADSFNELAKSYNKNPGLKSHYINDYAKKPHRLSLWYSGLAIEVLLEIGEDPFKLISLEQFVNAWLSIRKDTLSSAQAIRLFLKNFSDTVDKEKARELIVKRYEKE
jgi:hypothetical protein